ncbi:MAG: heavy-metal-associated domain-containing protein [Bacteroidales bacterium]|jgi:copper chaperone CopZ
MKTIKFILIIIAFSFISIEVNAKICQSNLNSNYSQRKQKNDKLKTESFKVYGSCEMCKSRIEKAAKVKGVSSVVWDIKTQILKITFDPNVVTLDKIHSNIARAGHDTDKMKASDKVYNALPKCCQYVRAK